MTLYLDTSNNLRTVVRLDNQEFVTTYTSPRDQDVLGALKASLHAAGQSVQNITQIEVHTGPGSFTGLRVGVAIANALGYALSVPVNGNPIGVAIEPEYGQQPTITSPHKA